MKKKVRIAIIICCIVFLIVASLLIFNSRYTVYELSPVLCRTMLGSAVTPESFVKDEGEGTVIEGGYTYAKVTRDGNLLLVLSNAERDAWKNAEVVLQILSRLWIDKKDIGVEITDFEEYIEVLLIEPGIQSGLELSEDYSCVIATSNDDTLYYPWFMLMGVEMQFFEGIPSDEIYVEYIEYNSDGKVCKRLTWPNDENIIWPGTNN